MCRLGGGRGCVEAAPHHLVGADFVALDIPEPGAHLARGFDREFELVAGPAQSGFGFALVGDVEVDADHAGKPAVGIETGVGIGAQPAPCAIGAAVAGFDAKRGLVGHRLTVGSGKAGAVFGVQGRGPCEGFKIGHAPEIAQGAVEKDAVSGSIAKPDHGRRRLEDCPCLGLGQGGGRAAVGRHGRVSRFHGVGSPSHLLHNSALCGSAAITRCAADGSV